MVEVIRNSYAASGGVYGARRVFGDLREAGETCGKHRVERLMRANKIKAVRGYKAPRAIAGRPSILSPNRLNREFTVNVKETMSWTSAALATEVHQSHGRMNQAPAGINPNCFKALIQRGALR